MHLSTGAQISLCILINLQYEKFCFSFLSHHGGVQSSWNQTQKELTLYNLQGQIGFRQSSYLMGQLCVGAIDDALSFRSFAVLNKVSHHRKKNLFLYAVSHDTFVCQQNQSKLPDEASSNNVPSYGIFVHQMNLSYR